MFVEDHRGKSLAHAEVYGRYERALTLISFLAAMMFVIGSVMFFFEALLYAGTWMFLIGSILFAVGPTLKVLREFHLARLPVPHDPEG